MGSDRVLDIGEWDFYIEEYSQQLVGTDRLNTSWAVQNCHVK